MRSETEIRDAIELMTWASEHLHRIGVVPVAASWSVIMFLEWAAGDTVPTVQDYLDRMMDIRNRINDALFPVENDQQ